MKKKSKTNLSPGAYRAIKNRYLSKLKTYYQYIDSGHAGIAFEECLKFKEIYAILTLIGEQDFANDLVDLSVKVVNRKFGTKDPMSKSIQSIVKRIEKEIERD